MGILLNKLNQIISLIHINEQMSILKILNWSNENVKIGPNEPYLIFHIRIKESL
jgi:hypothetical protein